ncbi:MAG: M3 family oligoendopeptidase [Proteobacteria bacterium]|nr:M3 family oligoendopeptidase [Pseudomonadota bacterium]MBU1739351.1 M3 family oligoendopeptidase [Pseudomonadota bacterium]
MNSVSNAALGTEKVLWKLEDLYSSQDDPALTRDLELCRSEATRLQEQYEYKIAELDGPALCELVAALEKLESLQGRIATFAFLNFTTRTRDAKAGAFLQKIKEFGSNIGRKTVFFELEWNRLDEKQVESLLGSHHLASYRHYLKSMRRYAPHQLSREEESLLIERAPVGRSSWNNLFDKVLGHLEFGINKRSEEEVLSDLYSADRLVRKQAAADLTGGLKSQLHVLTHIFNTILADKMIDDRLRAYPSWVSSMNLYNELEEKTVAALIESVTGRYDIVKRYYLLKRDLLGLDELVDYDRYAPLPFLPETSVSWSDCRKMVLDSFAEFSGEMAEIAEKFFTDAWIHAPIIEGKRAGAFAHPCVPEVHPYVMVNYAGTLRDVSTVAHELGHGVHQHLAARCGYYNSGTTLVLAETASVFAELLLFRSQLGMISGRKEKKAFICQKLESIFATVFRQVAMNRFEERIHTGRRESGELSPEEMTVHWLESQKEMFAGSVTLTDDYGVWWSYIPHFLNTPGYVYSYAFGELLVLSLYRIYQTDSEKFVPRYLELLASGGSMSPYELLQPFGIDLNDKSFWLGGLELIDDMLQEMEEL